MLVTLTNSSSHSANVYSANVMIAFFHSIATSKYSQLIFVRHDFRTFRNEHCFSTAFSPPSNAPLLFVSGRSLCLCRECPRGFLFGERLATVDERSLLNCQDIFARFSLAKIVIDYILVAAMPTHAVPYCLLSAALLTSHAANKWKRKQTEWMNEPTRLRSLLNSIN